MPTERGPIVVISPGSLEDSELVHSLSVGASSDVSEPSWAGGAKWRRRRSPRSRASIPPLITFAIWAAYHQAIAMATERKPAFGRASGGGRAQGPIVGASSLGEMS
jgi:hypothetical protein